LTKIILYKYLSIIGYNHYISYSLANSSANSLFVSYSDSSLNVGMKDLSIVGQMDGWQLNVNNAALFIINNSANLSNLNLYGNIRNVKYDDTSIRAGVLIENKAGTLSNINSNVSLNVTNAPFVGKGIIVGDTKIVGMFGSASLSLKNNIIYSGLIFGGRGDYGQDGAKGSLWTRGSRAGSTLYAKGGRGYAARNGGSGGSVYIYFYTKDNNLTETISNCNLILNGLVKAGECGAYGHHGDGGRGADLFELGDFYNRNYDRSKENIFACNPYTTYEQIEHQGGKGYAGIDRYTVDKITNSGVVYGYVDSNDSFGDNIMSLNLDNKVAQQPQNGRGGLGGFYLTAASWGYLNCQDKIYGFAYGYDNSNSCRDIITVETSNVWSGHCVHKNESHWDKAFYAKYN